MNEKKISTSTIAMIALMTAVTCILGPLSVPIGPVPISLTNLAIYFTVILLGWKKGTVSYVIYLLIGLVGVPVFSSFSAGPIIWPDRWLSDRIYFSGNDQWLVY